MAHRVFEQNVLGFIPFNFNSQEPWSLVIPNFSTAENQ